jgi:hypothetical protein
MRVQKINKATQCHIKNCEAAKATTMENGISFKSFREYNLHMKETGNGTDIPDRNVVNVKPCKDLTQRERNGSKPVAGTI